MRLNRYIATYAGHSRRKADELIENGEVSVNRKLAHVGMEVSQDDIVIISGKRLIPVKRPDMTIELHKPVGYVCSKDGQGSPTVYDLLPNGMHHLKVAGRLDKDTSGLVILTSDGKLLQELTHPSFNKLKKYIVLLNKSLQKNDIKHLSIGVDIGDSRLSKLKVQALESPRGQFAKYEVVIGEGRNRQIRRTFEALGYHIVGLHRTDLGPYQLGRIKPGAFTEV